MMGGFGPEKAELAALAAPFDPKTSLFASGAIGYGFSRNTREPRTPNGER